MPCTVYLFTTKKCSEWDSYYGLLKQFPQLLLWFSRDSWHQFWSRDLQHRQTHLLHTSDTHTHQIYSAVKTHTHIRVVSVTHSSHSLSQQRLSTPRRSVQQESTWRNDAEPLVHLRVSHVDQQLTDLLKKTSRRRLSDTRMWVGQTDEWMCEQMWSSTSRVSSLPPKSSNFTDENCSSWLLPQVKTRINCYLFILNLNYLHFWGINITEACPGHSVS